jgi:hypothetical protein
VVRMNPSVSQYRRLLARLTKYRAELDFRQFPSPYSAVSVMQRSGRLSTGGKTRESPYHAAVRSS